MAIRKAIVLIGGVRKELPAGDSLAGVQLLEPLVVNHSAWGGFSAAVPMLLAYPELLFSDTDVVTGVIQ